MLIKILKSMSYPVDFLINIVTNHKVEDVVWETLTQYECKTKGGYCRAISKGNMEVYGWYYCDWFYVEVRFLININPVIFLKENFKEWVDK